MIDLVVRGGRVFSAGELVERDIAVDGGRIVAVAPHIDEPAREEIDATGQMVLPGVVDAHVHFNDPGRSHWEGFATGSRALALGGGTCFVDMPLNAAPPTIDCEAFAAKRAAGEAASVLDFALWGGIVPHNLDRLEELAECGVVGFKAFMIESGIDDFPGVDARVLRAGMKAASRLGLPVAVHAEDAAIIARHTAAEKAAGRRDVRAFLNSRPVAAEVEAVRVALEIAGETGCSLHVVHVSAPEVLGPIAAAREAGMDVTAEVCTHHLLLDETAMFRHGAFAKCAPPLRPAATVSALWKEVAAGRVQMIGSDHSPAPQDMKTGDDVFAMWGGIMGCQHGFLLLLEAASGPGIWELASSAPAARFGLAPRKGRIAEGADADLVFLEPIPPRLITAEELAYRHRTSPYVGGEIRQRVARSLLRGRPVGAPGHPGQFLSRNLS